MCVSGEFLINQSSGFVSSVWRRVQSRWWFNLCVKRPCCKAMTATKEFDNLDSIEEGEDAERELQEAERKHREEIEKLEKESS